MHYCEHFQKDCQIFRLSRILLRDCTFFNNHCVTMVTIPFFLFPCFIIQFKLFSKTFYKKHLNSLLSHPLTEMTQTSHMNSLDQSFFTMTHFMFHNVSDYLFQMSLFSHVILLLSSLFSHVNFFLCGFIFHMATLYHIIHLVSHRFINICAHVISWHDMIKCSFTVYDQILFI